MTVSKQLWLGFGLLIVVLTLSVLGIAFGVRSVERDLHALTTEAEPISVAIFEMDLAIGSIGLGTMRYLATGESAGRERMATGSSRFEAFKAQYDRVAKSAEQKERGARIGALYPEYKSLAQTLIDQKDSQGQPRAEDLQKFLDLRDRIDVIVSREVKPWAQRETNTSSAAAYQHVHEILIAALLLLIAGLPITAGTSMAVGRGLVRADKSLRRSHEELEERVRQRTAELQAANAALQAQIAERRQVEAEMRAQQGFLNALLDNVADGIIACDAHGTLTLSNRATRELHGLPEQSLPPERWTEYYDMFQPDGTTPMRGEDVPLFRALRGERVRDAEVIVAPRNAPARTLLVSGQMIRDARGEKLGAVVSMHDITERKEADAVLRAFSQKLQESNRELEQFAAVASHDLQEPLRKIQAFGDRLQTRFADSLGEQGQEYIERMMASAARMRILINDLLDYSRVTTKGQPFVAVDLLAVTQQVMSDLAGRIEDTNGHVEVEELPTIDADPLQMHQLLQNLIANGLKFHKPGEAPLVRIESAIVEAENGGGRPWCRITIRDNGIGFEEAYRERIFELFQRLHGRNEYEGTGIGLAICRKIVQRHGGEITAESAPGRGAKFIVMLPVRHAQAEGRSDSLQPTLKENTS